MPWLCFVLPMSFTCLPDWCSLFHLPSTIHFPLILRVIDVAVCISSLFVFIPEQHSIRVSIQMCVYHNVFMHRPVDRLMGCFQFENITDFFSNPGRVKEMG